MSIMYNNQPLGLALGGGGALGSAHIGILRLFEEKGLKVDYIAGTSIGALIAALYAFGRDWKEMQKIAMELNWLDISGLSLSKYGVLSNRNLGKLLTKYIGEATFEEAQIPLAVIAANIASGEKVILDKGPVVPAVMASTSIPGIFNPVKIDDQLLVDGGIVESVPVSPLKKMGAQFIIAVDLNAKYPTNNPGNIVDILLNSYTFTLLSAAKLQTREADLLIQPDMSSFNKVRIRQAKKLIETGYQEAKNALKNLS